MFVIIYKICLCGTHNKYIPKGVKYIHVKDNVNVATPHGCRPIHTINRDIFFQDKNKPTILNSNNPNMPSRTIMGLVK
jgi:hypothetical protein